MRESLDIDQPVCAATVAGLSSLASRSSLRRTRTSSRATVGPMSDGGRADGSRDAGMATVTRSALPRRRPICEMQIAEVHPPNPIVSFYRTGHGEEVLYMAEFAVIQSPRFH